MTKIKICGINCNDSLDACVENQVDYIGFVFFPKSPRHITMPQAYEFQQRLNQAKTSAKKVALTVNASDELLQNIIDNLNPDILQLHGDETPQRVLEIKNIFHKPVWKAVPIHHKNDLKKSYEYSNDSRLLYDAKAPKNSLVPGGNACVFDWDILNYCSNNDYILAGGLSLNNIESAITVAKPYAVDVSSGVEEKRGCKSPVLIKKFINKVRDFSV